MSVADLNQVYHLLGLLEADAAARVATSASAQQIADLRKVMKQNRHHSLFKSGRLAESLAERQALMAALEARDADGSARLMQAHFENGLAAATP